MAAALKAFIAVAAIAVLAGTASAKNITVGAPGGTWDLTTKLTAWAQSQTFNVGDNLVFQYDKTQHDVLEVTKANYDSCGTSSPISSHTSGDDTFALTAVGNRYFICGKPQHCSLGMKIDVNTVAASGSPPPGSSPSPPPSTPGTTPSPPTGSSPPPPPPPSGASKATAGFGLGLGMLMVLAL